MTIQTVVHEINEEYLAQIDGIKKANPHDQVDLTGSKAAWKEVLSVYAIKVNTDPEDPQEVASMNVFKSEILKDIFWEMNEITYHTETKKEKVKEDILLVFLQSLYIAHVLLSYIYYL